ncbi:MAG: Gfo/Idh/MocA family oxidoreductase, partial [Robiginitalea sp.]|nr:Gfo/Idh/MocA family oxidoreductase [Robiginitalea sp.]
MKTRRSFLLPIFLAVVSLKSFGQDIPLKVGVIGLTHTHVHWIFESEKRGEIQIVGIVEPNRDLARRYADQHGFSMDKVYRTPEDLIAAGKPEAVTAFGTIYDHLQVVETFAPLGIHVMVEKPLAVRLDHGRKMASLAREHGIHLLTNYETTWYPSHHKVFEAVNTEQTIGPVRKVVVRDGHKGPKNIGVDPEFLEWLTDPELNGGGALMDFGCYGANLMTWLMEGEKPLSVTAITGQFQPENNPKVEDEAVILLKYRDAVAIIQASWNWPIGRKDLEVYGTEGAVFADNRHAYLIRIPTGYDTYEEASLDLPERDAPLDDPFAYFRAVVRGEITPGPYALSSLENNLMVREILDA